MSFNHLEEEVNKGLSGSNDGIPMGLTDLIGMLVLERVCTIL